MNRKLIYDGIEIFPLLVFITLTKLLSLKKRTAVGGWIISWLIRVNSNLRSRVIKNLELVMPSKTTSEKKSFLRELGWYLGVTFTELIFNAEFQKTKDNFSYSKNDLKPLFEAQKQGRPVIIVSAHLGPWEAIRAVLKTHNLTTGAIYKKNKNRFYENLHLKAIKYGGEPIFSTGLSGTRNMVKYLKNGGAVAVMLDQAASDGEFFNFLGLPAKTATSIAKIALKLDALVVPAYAIRSTNNQKIKIYFEEAILHTNYQEMTAQLNKSIERRILCHPEQWYWVHKRWKY